MPLTSRAPLRLTAAGPAAIALLLFSPFGLSAQDRPAEEEHFSVEKPAELTADEAGAIYDRIADEMIDGYRLSRDPNATDYRRWKRFNTTPYPSATHGSRYVNNYGNGLARIYERPEEVEVMPEGAVLAKDSFAVTADGNVSFGPLFLMEKMAPGFDPASRDWRYSMIMPDGSFFGITGGDNDERVRFCITCHQTAGDENDHLFFVPEAFRTGD
ncbi:MAG: cytochrome P460 family protein [Geminicoccaceae bacterium]